MTEIPTMRDPDIAERAARGGASGAPSTFGTHRRRNTPGLIGLQARILETVSGRPVLAGTLYGVAAQLNTGASPLREALRELRATGWVAVHSRHGEQMTVRLERRRYAGGAPASGERRQPYADAWVL
jgi:hypothetical protein